MGGEFCILKRGMFTLCNVEIRNPDTFFILVCFTVFIAFNSFFGAGTRKKRPVQHGNGYMLMRAWEIYRKKTGIFIIHIVEINMLERRIANESKSFPYKKIFRSGHSDSWPVRPKGRVGHDIVRY